MQGTLTSRTLKKGVWGMQRQIENPVKIEISGSENSTKQEERSNIIVQNILNIYREELPEVFNNIRPDELEFETLELQLRVHIDMGNKIMGIFLAALSCLYIFLENKRKEMDFETDYLFPLNYSILNKKGKETPLKFPHFNIPLTFLRASHRSQYTRGTSP